MSQQAQAMCTQIRPVIRWTTNEEHRTSEQVLAWQLTTNDFSVRHEHCWKLVVRPRRLAFQMEQEMFYTDDSEEVRRRTIVDTLSAELQFKQAEVMTATIKQDIQRTTEAISTWKSGKQEKIKVVYPAKTWTAIWILADTIHMNRKTTITNSCCQPRRYDPASVTEVSTTVEGMLSTYQDEASDEQMRLANPSAYDGFSR